VGSDDDYWQNAVKDKDKATTEILTKAKKGGFTIEQVKQKYEVTKQQETEFINL
jgi:hypothetical protein